MHFDSDGFDPDLRAALTRIARVPILLVACGYDGALAPIVEDFTAAVPLPEAIAAIRSLAALPQTTVAVISSRALRDLAALSRLPSEVHLVGSHGSEFDVGFVQRLPSELLELRGQIHDELSRIAAQHPGVRLEPKPGSITMHTRSVDPATAQAAVAMVKAGPANWPGVHTTQGKEVIELSVLPTDKGAAVDDLRLQASASAVLFFGDDTTDESAFARLQGPDLGIKVGPGETQALHRVDDPEGAVRCLAFLLQTRRNWLYGEQAVPIERHSMLSDGNTVALVTPGARVTWLCHPRPDSAAMFADLLGGSPAGHFSIRPARGGKPLGQRYRPGTMTVETRWSGLVVTDWLDGDSLMRRITGSTEAIIDFAPRPGFGQVQVTLQPLGDGLMVLGSNEPAALHAPGLEWDIYKEHGYDTARTRVDLAKVGGGLVVELRFGTHNLEPRLLTAQQRLERAERPWLDWASSLRLPARHRGEVLRSALTLRGLCHQPTGGILAAATTSLPEELGGVRNWD